MATSWSAALRIAVAMLLMATYGLAGGFYLVRYFLHRSAPEVRSRSPLLVLLSNGSAFAVNIAICAFEIYVNAAGITDVSQNLLLWLRFALFPQVVLPQVMRAARCWAAYENSGVPQAALHLQPPRVCTDAALFAACIVVLCVLTAVVAAATAADPFRKPENQCSSDRDEELPVVQMFLIAGTVILTVFFASRAAPAEARTGSLSVNLEVQLTALTWFLFSGSFVLFGYLSSDGYLTISDGECGLLRYILFAQGIVTGYIGLAAPFRGSLLRPTLLPTHGQEGWRGVPGDARGSDKAGQDLEAIYHAGDAVVDGKFSARNPAAHPRGPFATGPAAPPEDGASDVSKPSTARSGGRARSAQGQQDRPVRRMSDHVLRLLPLVSSHHPKAHSVKLRRGPPSDVSQRTESPNPLTASIAQTVHLGIEDVFSSFALLQELERIASRRRCEELVRFCKRERIYRRRTFELIEDEHRAFLAIVDKHFTPGHRDELNVSSPTRTRIQNVGRELGRFAQLRAGERRGIFQTAYHEVAELIVDNLFSELRESRSFHKWVEDNHAGSPAGDRLLAPSAAASSQGVRRALDASDSGVESSTLEAAEAAEDGRGEGDAA